ncbi:hypothetical protein SAMN05216553_106196 [Lentzea fradiae]|uniref:Uncharacterized protein n=1 Tax=Lentzea fradiae TaxID=200378 RepID=A0A1G7SDY4_9PSEU|nr:hypothetical protein [Lentzea fradiae]SDG21114.1 hypothetical protein SAMN05216553_106196 [Lentzea fradiae]
MFDGRTGEFVLKRQKGGVGYFGQVRVRVVAGVEPVVWQVDPADSSSLQPGTDHELVAAALAGVADGLRLVAEAGVDVTGWSAEVVHVQLNFTDIEESAVRAAGALAVGDAFEVGMEPVFDGGWTARLAG